MKNVVECYKEFFGYFNALETNGDFRPKKISTSTNNLKVKSRLPSLRSKFSYPSRYERNLILNFFDPVYYRLRFYHHL